MVTGKTPIVYWDACIFIAWLTDEKRAAGEMAGVYGTAQDVFDHKVKLITSSLTLVEIPDLPRAAMKKFVRLFDRRNISMIAADNRVMRRAQELRAFYRKKKIGRLCTADAIHLATALTKNADAFHTFDAKGKNNCLGLLPLSGSVAGYTLTICKPSPPGGQGILDI